VPTIYDGLQRIDMSLSNDGGYQYESSFPKYLHRTGKRKSIVQWFGLGGIANDMCVQFRFWGRGRFVITDGFAGLYT
jgi:hypothetical protein